MSHMPAAFPGPHASRVPWAACQPRSLSHMPAGSQILTGIIMKVKPNELFYSFEQAVHTLENKTDGKSMYYAELLNSLE